MHGSREFCISLPAIDTIWDEVPDLVTSCRDVTNLCKTIHYNYMQVQAGLCPLESVRQVKPNLLDSYSMQACRQDEAD